MIVFLRFVGLMNAAIWAGSAVCFTIAVWPAFSAEALERLLPLAYRDQTFLILLNRYFVVHQYCAIIALVHLGVEWLYTGKAVSRLQSGLIIGTLCGALFGGLLLQPRMEYNHLARLKSDLPAGQRKKADSAYGILYGLTQVVNAAMLVSVLVYTWRLANPANPPRFVSTTRFRG